MAAFISTLESAPETAAAPSSPVAGLVPVLAEALRPVVDAVLASLASGLAPDQGIWDADPMIFPEIYAFLPRR
jgi:hypothetical protein